MLYLQYYLWVTTLAALSSFANAGLPDSALENRQAEPSPGLLTNFQVYQPVLTPSGSSNQYGCVYTKTLMVRDFAFSYGKPFVGNYTPPPCSFNRVTMNFTVTSRGRQFDRLGIMYLGDIEVFRTSTAEPTRDGIIWTYVKEMQHYDVLWHEAQKIIFDLGNLVDDTYTGIYNTTLTATFFTIPNSTSAADTILPISARRSSSDMPSAFQVPDQAASVSYTLPRNVDRAIVSLAACGQSTEEFWYTNVLTSYQDTFANTTGPLSGGGPWREVQLLIDGQLAGVLWPFTIIFTGGIAPGFWRPIVGIDAFDLREREIDISPWLPLLLDGASHTFEIKVASLNDDGAGHATVNDTTGPYWVVSGKIFLFLDEPDSITTGTTPSIVAEPPMISISSSITQNSTGANETLTYRTTASRNLSISSNLTASSGTRRASWTQSLSFENYNQLSSQGLVQFTRQETRGRDVGAALSITNYTYPLVVNSSYYVSPSNVVSINATLSRGLDLLISGPTVFPTGLENFNLTDVLVFMNYSGATNSTQPMTLSEATQRFDKSELNTVQEGNAGYFSDPNNANTSYSYGSTEQDFSFKGFDEGSGDDGTELYHRHVRAVNSSVVEDQIDFGTYGIPGLGPTVLGEAVDPVEREDPVEGTNVRAVLGRGPGRPKAGAGGGR